MRTTAQEANPAVRVRTLSPVPAPAPSPSPPRSPGSQGEPVGLLHRPNAVTRRYRARFPAKAQLQLRPVEPAQFRAWALVLMADVVGLALPAAFMSSGRLAVAGFALLCVLLFHGGRLYRPRLHLSVLDELPALLTRALAAAAVVGAGVHLMALRPGVDAFARVVAVGLVAQVLLRSVAYAVVRRTRSTGRVGHTALLVGGGAVSGQLARTLTDQPSYGLRPLGFLDDEPLLAGVDSAVPHLGRLDQLPEVLAAHDVQVLLVAFGRHSDSVLVDVMRASERSGCEVFVVPRLYEIHDADASDHIGAVPVVRMRRRRLRASWQIKRLVDVVVSATALLLLAPVLAVIALAVRLEGGPGVLFRQVRVGFDGREFEVLKFRSLKPVDESESATNWNISHDSRLGPVGRVLRKTSLDELPQLWNVLRGEMSIVGPRPERPHFVQMFADEHPRYLHRHRVPSGLTGLAQVNGLRGDTSIADRARYDNYYIENWSLWLDCKIVLQTVREVLFARGG